MVLFISQNTEEMVHYVSQHNGKNGPFRPPQILVKLVNNARFRERR